VSLGGWRCALVAICITESIGVGPRVNPAYWAHFRMVFDSELKGALSPMVSW